METKKSVWPKAIIAFFAVVFSMNGFFIYKAVSSFDGLVEEDYYLKGLNYNNTIQYTKRLGWKIDLSFSDDLKASAHNKAKVIIFDRNGEPIGGASVRVSLRRPATSRFDNTFELVPSGCAYHGNISIPVDGLWDITIQAEKGTDKMEKVFRVRTEDGSGVKI